MLLVFVAGCRSTQSAEMPPSKTDGQIPDYCPEQALSSAQAPSTQVALNLRLSDNGLVLEQSWAAFRDRYIQADGRVIDREVSDRSTSAGQALAMFQAVLVNDHKTFARVLTWGENNLSRKDAKGQRIEQLWARSWGQTVNKEWRILEPSFTSGADVDAATALILAARRWNCPRYLEIARTKLDDLWNLATGVVNGKRYLLSTSDPVFWAEPNTLLLNPSYFAPYAFRLFAQVDSKHDWSSLIESGYQMLNESAKLSEVRLPSDWILLNSSTGKILSLAGYGSQQSLYSSDAASVWWRVALDAVWFQAPQAKRYLNERTTYLKQLWQTNQKISAKIDLQGKPIVDYEATSQYAMLYAALQLTDSRVADQIYQLKLKPRYKGGFWDNDSAYSTQNAVSLALLAPVSPTPLLSP